MHVLKYDSGGQVQVDSEVTLEEDTQSNAKLFSRNFSLSISLLQHLRQVP